MIDIRVCLPPSPWSVCAVAVFLRTTTPPKLYVHMYGHVYAHVYEYVQHWCACARAEVCVITLASSCGLLWVGGLEGRSRRRGKASHSNHQPVGCPRWSEFDSHLWSLDTSNV